MGSLSRGTCWKCQETAAVVQQIVQYLELWCRAGHGALRGKLLKQLRALGISGGLLVPRWLEIVALGYLAECNRSLIVSITTKQMVKVDQSCWLTILALARPIIDINNR